MVGYESVEEPPYLLEQVRFYSLNSDFNLFDPKEKNIWKFFTFTQH